MAKTTIHSLAYQILMDTEGFTKGASLAASDSRKLGKTIQDLKTPMERAEDQVRLLAKGLQTGKLTSAQFDTAMEQLSKSFDKTEKSGNRLVAFFKDRFRFTLTDVFNVAKMGIRTITSLGGALSSTAEELDVLAKRSRNLKIDPGVLKELGIAVERLTESSSEQFDKSLERMVKRLGEFKHNAGEAKTALIDLGFTAEDFKNVDTETAFFKIIDAIAAEKDVGLQAAFTAKIFGDEAKALLNMFSQGSGALHTTAELRAAGVFELGRIEHIEEMRDSLADAHEIWKSAMQSLVVDIAPAVRFIADTIRHMMPKPADTPVERDRKTLGMPAVWSQREQQYWNSVGTTLGAAWSGRFTRGILGAEKLDPKVLEGIAAQKQAAAETARLRVLAEHQQNRQMPNGDF